MRQRPSEQRALELLKQHFQEYNGLVSSEKPDLIDRDKSIGVEVTSALNPKVEEREVYFYKEMKGKHKSSFTAQEIETVEQHGLKIVSCAGFNGTCEEKMLGLVRVFGTEELDQLHTAIRNKYKKEYERVDRLDLYIFFRQICAEGISDFEIIRLFETAHKCEEKYGAVFQKIMIDFYEVLLVMDVQRNSTEKITDYIK